MFSEHVANCALCIASLSLAKEFYLFKLSSSLTTLIVTWGTNNEDISKKILHYKLSTTIDLMLYNSVTKKPTLIVTISVEFFAERLSSVYSAEVKSWRPQI